MCWPRTWTLSSKPFIHQDVLNLLPFSASKILSTEAASKIILEHLMSQPNPTTPCCLAWPLFEMYLLSLPQYLLQEASPKPHTLSDHRRASVPALSLSAITTLCYNNWFRMCIPQHTLSQCTVKPIMAAPDYLHRTGVERRQTVWKVWTRNPFMLVY